MTPPTACKTNGCGGISVERGLCAVCLKDAPAVPQFVSKFDESRPWKHLYWKSRWRHPVTGLQVTILRRDPLCKECNRNASTIADHVTDHRGDPVLFFNPKNLRGVCKECHDKKTGSMHGGGSRGGSPPPAVLDGKVVTGITVPEVSTELPAFDFLAAAEQYRVCPTCQQQKRLCTCGS